MSATAARRTADIGECRACGKIRYATRDHARHAARVIGAKFGARMRAYECESYWHLTSYTADEMASIRAHAAGENFPGRCEACGKVPYPSRGAAEAAAQEQMAAVSGLHLSAATCGVFWHLSQNRWHGRAYPGASRDVREAKRLEAEQRNAATHPSMRSTKGRAKRAKGTPPASKQEAA